MSTSTASDPQATHTVLIVEDEEDLRELMGDVLTLQGYSVVTAREGADALHKLETIGRPCMILLDLFMPGMNGWEFFERLQENPDLASVPVIVHSSAAERAPTGVAKAIDKPMSAHRLIATVSEYCKQQ